MKHIDIKDQNKLAKVLEEIRKKGEVQKGFWTKEENVVRFFQLIDDYLNCKFEENRKIFKKIISKFLEGRIQTYDESDAFFRKAIIEMFPSDIEFLCRLVEQDYATMEFPVGYSQDDKETSYIKSLVQENPELYRNLEQLIQRGFAINASGFVGGWIYKLSDWGRIFIPGFAYISRTFPLGIKLEEQPASTSSEEISLYPLCGLLIGIYMFYENWSTETFRKKDSKKWAVYYTYLYVT